MEMPPTFTVTKELRLDQYLIYVSEEKLSGLPSREWFEEINKVAPIVNEFVGRNDRIAEALNAFEEALQKFEALPPQQNQDHFALAYDAHQRMLSLFDEMYHAVADKFYEIADDEEDDEIG